jgi:hypothetical protein
MRYWVLIKDSKVQRCVEVSTSSPLESIAVRRHYGPFPGNYWRGTVDAKSSEQAIARCLHEYESVYGEST